MEQDDLTVTLNQKKKMIMKNMFKEKKIPDDYHTLDIVGHVTLICLNTGHNRLNSHMNRRVNLVPSPTTLFRARTGTLKLNIERRHTDGYTNCEICKENTTEDIEHFVLDCEALTSARQYVTDHTKKTERHIIMHLYSTSI